MTSDEQNVAQVGKELLEASGNFTPFTLALSETDNELTLPAVVISARHEEDTQIILGGTEMNRSALSFEIREIQQQVAVSALDAAFDGIDAVLHPSTPQSVPSATFFTG